MVLLVLLLLANKGRLNTFNSFLGASSAADCVRGKPKRPALHADGCVRYLASKAEAANCHHRPGRLGRGDRIVGIYAELNYREFSAERYLLNIMSIFDPEKAAEIDPQGQGTKRWRLMWWTKIFDNAVETPYVFIGAGWGENLAVQYGIYRISSSWLAGRRAVAEPAQHFLQYVGTRGVDC